MMNDQLISQFIDNELSLDEKLHFVELLLANRAFGDETRSLLYMEQQLHGVGREVACSLPDRFTARSHPDGAHQTDIRHPADTADTTHKTGRIAFLSRLRAMGEELIRNIRLNWMQQATGFVTALLLVWLFSPVLVHQNKDNPFVQQHLAGQANSAGAPGSSGVPETLEATEATGPNQAIVENHRFVLYHPGASETKIVGSFTGWKPVAMQRAGNTGYWSLTLPLPPGEHRYSFIMEDGAPIPDPSINTREADDFGGENSVIVVGQNYGPLS